LSITIRNLNNIKHCIDKYAIVLIFFLEIKNDKQVFAKITCKMHLINNFKTNMLIENNVIDFEKIVINIVSKFVYIKSCIVIVNLKVKTICTIVYKRVYVKKVVNVSSKLEITISMHYTFISSNRDFLFKSNELNLSLYVYLVNFDTRNIVVRNNSKKVVYILRNC